MTAIAFAFNPREIGPRVIRYTNLFLLLQSSEVPELWLRSEEEYRLYTELKRAVHNLTINDDGDDISFIYNDAMIVFHDRSIDVYRDKRQIAKYEVEDFTRASTAVFRRLLKEL